MKKAYFVYLVAAPLALIFPTALAGQPVDNYASALLASTNYPGAIDALEPIVRNDPADEVAVLNLALAYRQTGRLGEARRLYRRVLFRDDVELDTANGRKAWSHDVARIGLAAMPQMSAR
ncbi:MAG: tetratricopeptide repeat protein [Sphingomonadaceae bacterium]